MMCKDQNCELAITPISVTINKSISYPLAIKYKKIPA